METLRAVRNAKQNVGEMWGEEVMQSLKARNMSSTIASPGFPSVGERNRMNKSSTGLRDSNLKQSITKISEEMFASTKLPITGCFEGASY